jgi:hypothetical protein
MRCLAHVDRVIDPPVDLLLILTFGSQNRQQPSIRPNGYSVDGSDHSFAAIATD